MIIPYLNKSQIRKQSLPETGKYPASRGRKIRTKNRKQPFLSERRPNGVHFLASEFIPWLLNPWHGCASAVNLPFV